MHEHEEHDEVEEELNFKVEYTKFAVLIGLIVLVSVFLNSWFGSGDITNVMRWFMGIAFLTFGTFKFIGYEMFTQMFPDYDIIAARSRFYTYFYPFLELGLGVMYLLNIFPVPRDLFTLVLMSVSAYGVYQTLRSREVLYCACLGHIIKLPLSKTSLLEDSIMALMALFLLIGNLM